MTERPWLLLPVKSLDRGKLRLASVLSDMQRRQLNEDFLRHMLAVAAQFPGLQNTAVVSDAADTLTFAAKFGAHTIRCQGEGLNRALTTGHRTLSRICARQLLIFPVDLPFVQACDLFKIAALGDHHPVIICPDKDLGGTNALGLSGGVPLRFHFGRNSYSRHQAEARRHGITPFLLYDERIAKDIDRPDDLAKLRQAARYLGH
jgi:2-phospho-L-lactate guanylyltransferase